MRESLLQLLKARKTDVGPGLVTLERGIDREHLLVYVGQPEAIRPVTGKTRNPTAPVYTPPGQSQTATNSIP